jgi:hypothetical protein
MTEKLDNPSFGTSAHSNPARIVAVQTLSHVLNDVIGKKRVSEITLREAWLEALRDHPSVSMNGWYDPPPGGVGILFGTEADGEFRAESLRPQSRWPTKRFMDWRHGYVYAYCSPVDIGTGLAGDFGVTLYFGNDGRIVRHFQRCMEATGEIVSSIKRDSRSGAVCRQAQEILAGYHLEMYIRSQTNFSEVDLGHSLPKVPVGMIKDRELTSNGIEYARVNRRFLSAGSDWELADGEQVTIEPSAISSKDRSLPQVSPHIVVGAAGDRLQVLDECTPLMKQFGLV